MIHKTTRSILSVLLAALLLVTSTPLTPAFAGEEEAVSLQSESGEGGELKKADDGKYYISTAKQLKEFADKVNKGETDAWAVLTADINLNPDMKIDEDGKVTNGNDLDPWTPIGTSESTAYTGTFNGDGHTISGLYINSSDTDYQGLFGYVSGTVQNLSVSGEVTGNIRVGGVVGDNRGTVENCYNTGNISGNSYVGGVVGYNYPGASVENCYNTGSVNGSGNSVGGVVGYNGSGSVTNSYNTGEVSGYSHVGGVVGGNSDSTVENCYNTGSVNGSGNLYVGGVVGHNSISSSVTNCYNTGAVSGGEDAGGVVGENSNGGNVTGCYFLKTETVNTELQGIGNGSGEAAAVDNLTDQDQFEGWDFIDTWRISGILGRPVLQDNAQDGLPPGLGTKEHPYEIKTADELENFRDLVNGEDGQTADTDAHAKLMNNIDLKDVCGSELNGGTSWTPIGSDSRRYTGTFDGNGHTISGLYIKNTTSDYYQGLFGYVDQGGTVQNLSVSGTVNSSYVGGVVGLNSGNVENCYNTGTVTGTVSASGNSSVVGGVVGYNNGSVTNCYNTGTVTGTVSSDYVGGVVGRNFGGTVENCYNTGSVSGSGNSVGGVVGLNSGSVTNCYFLQTETVNTKLQGIGENDGSGVATATEKDDTAFHSGEVAWLLENGQAEDQTTPVWGQNLMNEPKDNYPQLRAFDADTPQVYKVAFMNDSEEHDAQYANSGMTVDLPATEPTKEGYTFSYWQDKAGTQVTEPITVTADTTFTAQWTKDTVNYTVSVSADPEAGGTVSGSGEYSEGTQVTVTATANDGYTFVAWQEGGTKIENAGTSYTFTVKGNRSLTAVFEKDEEPEPTPTPTPDPEPSGPSTGDSTGWDDIRDELENAAKGEQITIDMGDETKVPAEIFESLAGKDVEISFDLGDDLSWTVNGKDIPDDAALADLDLGVALDTDGIPANVVNAITGEVGTVQITLAHDGEFGFTMTLTAPLGKENAGYWANLYHYDERAEALNFEATAKIDEDGSVKIPFTHASQYAIVIDTHGHAAVDVSDLFIDVAPDAWYKDAVQYAYDNGLMTGTSANEFAPEQTTTRAMIVSILARLENVTTAEAAGFADVDDEWYATAVNWAANVGVVNGYEDNTFRPNTAITREQLAAILMNYAACIGEDVSNRADLSAYSDTATISSWANDVMQWAVAEGLISGVTNDQLQPQSSATRAQVAAILQRFLSE